MNEGLRQGNVWPLRNGQALTPGRAVGSAVAWRPPRSPGPN